MFQRIQTATKTSIDTFKRHPLRYGLLGGSLFLVTLLALTFWPRTITFSYAGTTCFYQPTLAPDLLRSHSDGFKLVADQKLTLGGVTLGAARLCAIATAPPQEGTSTVALSLGGSLLRKEYRIRVPGPPKAAVSSVISKPLPVTRAVTFPLSTPDTVFAYKVMANGKTAACSTKNDSLVCDIPRLELAQGERYSLRLERYFAGKKAGTVAAHDVTTLTATFVTGASIKESETVYARPKSIEITTDKDIGAASLRLVRTDGGKQEAVTVKTAYEGKKLTVSWDAELARQASFELIADAITGKDGSGLDGAYALRFVTSGGPKVKSVSVGTYKVPLGTKAVITFDQPIQQSQDLSGVISANGGAVVAGKQANQVFVDFAGVPRCGGVTITVSDALKSDHDITGGSAWRYDTRTVCQVVGSIGVSHKGRSITTYAFGSGPNVILFTGAIHGNEASTRSLMLRWIDALEARPSQIPADKTVVVIPAINPDGVAAGSRTNARNVDLNRNFATSDWKSDITTTSNAPFPGGGGPSALSEPESQALASYVSRVRPRLVLSYHSVGSLLAANQAGDSNARAATYARISGYANTTGSSDTFEYGISGTADDYYGQVLGVPSVLIELGSHTGDQFSRNGDAMWAMVK